MKMDLMKQIEKVFSTRKIKDTETPIEGLDFKEKEKLLKEIYPIIRNAINTSHSINLWIHVPEKDSEDTIYIIALKNSKSFDTSNDIEFISFLKIEKQNFWKFRKNFLMLIDKIMQNASAQIGNEINRMKVQGNNISLQLFSNNIQKFRNYIMEEKVKWVWIFYESRKGLEKDPMWEWIYTQLPDKSNVGDFFWGDQFYIVRKFKEVPEGGQFYNWKLDIDKVVRPKSSLTLRDKNKNWDYINLKLTKTCKNNCEILLNTNNKLDNGDLLKNIKGRNYDIAHVAVPRSFFKDYSLSERANSVKIIFFCTACSIERIDDSGFSMDLLDYLVMNNKETLARIDTINLIPDSVSFIFAKCFYDEFLSGNVCIAKALANARKKLKGELPLFSIDISTFENAEQNPNCLKDIFFKFGFSISNSIRENSIGKTECLINDMFIAKKCGVNMKIYKRSNNECFYRFAFILNGNPCTHIMGGG